MTDGLLLLINSNVQSTPTVRHGEAARYPQGRQPRVGVPRWRLIKSRLAPNLVRLASSLSPPHTAKRVAKSLEVCTVLLIARGYKSLHGPSQSPVRHTHSFESSSALLSLVSSLPRSTRRLARHRDSSQPSFPCLARPTPSRTNRRSLRDHKFPQSPCSSARSGRRTRAAAASTRLRG